MDVHYIDTSFLAPYYLPEAASETVERKLRSLPEGSLVISPLVRVEFASLLFAVAARHDAVLWTLDKSLTHAAEWAGLKTRK